MRRLISLAAILCVIALSVPAMAAIEIIVPHRNAPVTFGWSFGNSATNKYGADYRLVKQSAGGGYIATYTPNIPVTASDWQVYVWYPTITSQTTSAQYIVHRTSGTDATVTKNQTTSRGTWVLIGTYTMGAGTGNYLKITSVGASTTYVAADAVRFYSATATDSTPPTISGVTSIPGTFSAVVNWTTNEQSTSQVAYGPTALYGSLTTKDITLATNHQVIITGLSPSSQYHFLVKSTDPGSNTTTSADYVFTTAASTTPELRGCWLYTWGDSMLSADQITSAVDTLYNANYNVMIPEIRKAGDAYYDSAYEPRASNIIDPLPFDPLADMITKAHAKGMEVHGWFTTYRIWSSGFGTPPSSHIWAQHPEYAMKTSGGSIADGANYNLDPGVPATQDYISKVLIDMITKYDLDGLNFDYVRYPGTDWGYNEITKERFMQEYGSYPPTSTSSPLWDPWCDFRRQQVTDLVKKCYLEVMWRKPNVKMCVDTVGWTAGDPNVDFTQTRQYTDVFQNAKSWMEQHIIDINRLMNYKREYDYTQAADYRLWNHWLGTMQQTSGRHSVSGPGVYMNYTADSMTQLAHARSEGLSGLSTYAYHATNIGGDSGATFYNTTKLQMFPEPAPIPEMPWKTSPTTGIIFGTVTNAAQPNDPIYQNWVYKATVTATGPVTQTTTTDATGTYGFIDLPVGTYSISVSKTGFPARTYSGQKINAGDVLREDFDLGYVTATAPAGTVSGEYNWISFPLEPVNKNPVSVLPGIRLDGRLYRFTNLNQSQDMYDEYMPDYFGNLRMDEGYTLIVDAPYTISYQAYAGSPAMRDIPLPTAGQAFISCPLNRIVPWDKVLVTKNGVTVDMHTAAKTNNWLSSTAFGWDSPTQSMYDIGLPEDWPGGGTSMKPWYAYWMETYTNGLTLTLK